MDDPRDNILKGLFEMSLFDIPRDIILSLFRPVKNGLKCYIIRWYIKHKKKGAVKTCYVSSVEKRHVS